MDGIYIPLALISDAAEEVRRFWDRFNPWLLTIGVMEAETALKL